MFAFELGWVQIHDHSSKTLIDILNGQMRSQSKLTAALLKCPLFWATGSPRLWWKMSQKLKMASRYVQFGVLKRASGYVCFAMLKMASGYVRFVVLFSVGHKAPWSLQQELTYIYIKAPLRNSTCMFKEHMHANFQVPVQMHKEDSVWFETMKQWFCHL